MLNKLFTIFLCFLLIFLGFIGKEKFINAASLTVISGTDLLTNFPAVYNADLAEINSQLTYGTSTIIHTLSSATAFRIYNSVGSSTVLTVSSSEGSTTVAGILYASSVFATSTTATSTFRTSMVFGDDDMSINGVHYKWPSSGGTSGQQLEINGAGTLSWAAAAGSGPTVNTGTADRFAYYSGASTLDSANSFQINASSGSTTFPTLNVGTLTATTGTSYINALSLGTVLSVGNGGSGAGTFTTSGILFGNGTSAFGVTNAGASSTVLTTDGTTPRFNTGLSLTSLTVSASTTIDTIWVNTVATTSRLEVRGSFSTRIASTTGATSQTIDWNNGSIQRFILEGNTTFILNATSSNPQNGGRYVLKLCQDSTGSRTVTWSTPGQIRWWRGTTTITSTAGQCTYLGMVWDSRSSHYDIIASSTGIVDQ